jgi:pimeloyl-ACP methyl ester carboxylesterase
MLDLPESGLPAKGEDLLLAAKMGAICQLSYRNSDLSDDFKESEAKFLETLHITEYKIWSENLTDVKDKPGQRNADSQAITGVISFCTDDYPDPKPFVCFRGTKSFSDMLHDLASVINVGFKTIGGVEIGNTGLGFVSKHEIFQKLGLLTHVVELVKKYNNGLFIIGHSLGGAVANLFTAELAHDFPEFFQWTSDEKFAKMVQVTFGAPRVYDKITALKINALTFQNLRFVNQTDLIPTLPHWKMKSLYHTGDCYYVEDQRHVWHMIKGTNHNNHQDEDGDDDPDDQKQVMSFAERNFNFASDAVVDPDTFADTFAKFAIGGGDTHALSEYSGYLDQVINSRSYKEQLSNVQNAEVKKTFENLPVEISKPNEMKELGKAVMDLGSALFA